MVWPMVGFVVFICCFYGLFLLNESEGVRGETIKQDKMLHDPHTVVDLLGQISRSNAGSKSLVKIMGRICRSNCWSNLSVELLGQIAGSNLLVKLLGHVTSGVTSVTSHVTQTHASNAANPQPAAGQPRRMHGRAYGQPENGLGWAVKGQRKTPRCDAWGLVNWIVSVLSGFYR